MGGAIPESAKLLHIRASSVDGGRIDGIAARSGMPVSSDLESRLSRYISSESRLAVHDG